MWKLYDELIEAIPAGIKISDIAQTSRWTFVANDKTIGTAMKFNSSNQPLEQYQSIQLQEAAALIKSWDFQKASFGLAAINSFFNEREKVSKNFIPERIQYRDAFDQLLTEPNQKKIGMIGHFPFIDRYPEFRKQISIFELEPRKGDYPASACEYLLPQMELVYITGSTLINKTLPRLLELSENATTVLVGSSCPLSAGLFNHGIDTLASTLYEDSLTELQAKKSAGGLPLSKYGHSIMIEKGKGQKI
jgi:uncharacterized protein (DUF4213/DUF364 family)